ncbi:MAG: NADH:flavin oxidoreductase [Chitinispirillaceae bacterium]|nr:NADH:flavin oxidoreductase [Chitinispirillaceae bacterium]
MQVFENASLGSLTIPNRIIRSATFEGGCDGAGRPAGPYELLYQRLAHTGIGAIITGFAFTQKHGKAMQPGQAGIDSDDAIPAFSRITAMVHGHGGRIIMQIAHAGRQTISEATAGPVYGASDRRSPYFRSRPQRLTIPQIETIIEGFSRAALRCREAGFDGVQLHAAHGYLIHQFLNRAVNDRTDLFGIDKDSGIGTAFLGRIIRRVRELCGARFPLLVKISAGDEYRRGMTGEPFLSLVRFLDTQPVDAIEVSWGTMDHALNIFRGKTVPLKAILDHNPRYGSSNPLVRRAFTSFVFPLLRARFKPFSPAYNLPHALAAKKHTRLPVICVGGFRSRQEIINAIEQEGIDFVSACRPFINDPGFANKLRNNRNHLSPCIDCNRCAIMCDAGRPTRCYARPAVNNP